MAEVQEPSVTRARCKFRCEEVKPDYPGSTSRQVRLRAHYDPELCKEDAAFSRFTPAGTLQMQIDNPRLNDFFEPGKTYYIEVFPTE